MERCTTRRRWHIVTAMALTPGLLIACVALSWACSSKRTAPAAERTAERRRAPLQTVVVDADESTERMFEVLRTATTEHVVLVIDGTSYPVHYTSRGFADGPGMVARLTREGVVELWSTSGTEGTAEKPLVARPLDEPGRDTIRRVLAGVVTRSGAKRIDVIVERGESARALAMLLEAVRPPFADVRVAASVPAIPAQRTTQVADRDATLHAAIVANEKPLRRCFEQSLGRDGPTASMRLPVELAIDDTGAVSWVKVGGAHSRQLGDCVGAVVRSWKLAAAAGSYTFHIDMTAR